MKNKQMSITVTFRNSCIDPNSALLKLLPGAEMSASESGIDEDLQQFFGECMDAGYVTIKTVEVTDCDCEVE